jgi:hypothetical protein
MADSPNPYSTPRPPRVKLAGSVLALIQLGDQQVRAKLHQLNINGGLLHLPEPLQEAPVRVIFHVGSTTVRAGAETITPFWATKGWLQPFRFTDFDENDRRRLDADLLNMLGRARHLPDEHSAGDPQIAAQEASPLPREQSEVLVEGQAVPAPQAAAPAANDALDGKSEVVLYFDHREDAIRFTVALSSVIFCDQAGRRRDDIAKLAREFTKISRVTT